MATHEATIHPFPAQGRTPLTITSEDISRYAELSALVSQLEARQKGLRSELLTLRSAGAELAAKVYGIEKAAAWKIEVEASAPIQPITQIRVKPNPAFAAGLTKPVMSMRFPVTPQIS
jgi:hypothetical protein